MRVALVDDDDAMRESLTFLVETIGYQVSSYASAREFFDGCDIARIAGLLLDQHLIEETGIELAARLRADGLQIPILLMTAAPSPAIALKAAELRIDSVLTNPFSEADILHFLTRL